MQVAKNRYQYSARDLRGVWAGLPQKYTQALGITLLKPDGSPHANPMEPGQLFEAFYNGQNLMYEDLSVATTEFTNIFYANIFLIEKMMRLQETMETLLDIDNWREKNISVTTGINDDKSTHNQTYFAATSSSGKTDASAGSSDSNSKYFGMEDLALPYQKGAKGTETPKAVVPVPNEDGSVQNVSITPSLDSFTRNIGVNNGNSTQLNINGSEDSNTGFRVSGTNSYTANKVKENLSRISAQLPDLRNQFFEKFKDMFCVYLTPG